ncbi:MAG: hypothetical protein RMY34_04190 [Aulosira sp. DedQUE10]|nr:hypothetical protein [Aulosira sp. DedQUE10]
MFASLEYCNTRNQRTAPGQLEPLGIASKVWQCWAASGKCLRKHDNFWYDSLNCYLIL